MLLLLLSELPFSQIVMLEFGAETQSLQSRNAGKRQEYNTPRTMLGRFRSTTQRARSILCANVGQCTDSAARVTLLIRIVRSTADDTLC